MKRWIAMLLMLCAFSVCAQAQSVPLTAYWPGQMIDAGFSQPVRIIGEYNRAWRIVAEGAGTYFIHVDNLQ